MLIILYAFFWPTIKKTLYPLFEPLVVSYADSKGALGFFPTFIQTYVISHKTLENENTALKAVIETLENQVAKQDAELREYGLIHDENASSSFPVEDKPIVMYPLSQDITKLYSSIVLSKGFKDGVAVNMLVSVKGRNVVCRIKEVYRSTSLCELLSSYGVTTEGVTSSSSVTLTLSGRGGHYLGDVARDTPITEGEKVYLRSNPSLVLGTVRQVLTNNQATSWYVFVETVYNPVSSSVFYAEQE